MHCLDTNAASQLACEFDLSPTRQCWRLVKPRARHVLGPTTLSGGNRLFPMRANLHVRVIVEVQCSKLGVYRKARRCEILVRMHMTCKWHFLHPSFIAE